jgi:hypothetical protein
MLRAELLALAKRIQEREDHWFSIYLNRDVSLAPGWEVWSSSYSTIASVPDQELARFIAACHPSAIIELLEEADPIPSHQLDFDD